MNKENIVDVDATEAEIEDRLHNTVEVGDESLELSGIITDIQTAHKQLDEYKAGSLSLAQTLSEAAEETDDETLRAILSDLSDESFGVYLRLHRGDKELLGERDGEYSGLLIQ